jgi:feruloyl esterase
MNATKLIFTVSCILFCFGINAQNGLTEIKDHGSNPGNLNMYMHIPVTAGDSIKRKPLVVVLHGCSQNAGIVARQSGWNKLADHFGFYVLYPSQKMLNNMGGCFNWYKKSDITKDEGEVLSLKQMIDVAIEKYPVDSGKIFVYGLSAGAAMGVALLSDYPYLFNAGAILSGGPFMSATNAIGGVITMFAPSNKSAKKLADPVLAQNPGYKNEYPRLIVMHGKDDNVVNIKNSYRLIEQWSYLHHTDNIADTTIIAFEKHTDITKYFYRDPQKKDVIIFYEVEGLGHALMVDPGDEITRGGETGTFAVDNGFFSTYWIAVDFGLIDPAKQTKQ